MHMNIGTKGLSLLTAFCLLLGGNMATAFSKEWTANDDGVALQDIMTELGLADGAESELTLDAELQKIAADALAKYSNPQAIGVVVVMDMEGRVLAMTDNQQDGVPQALIASGAPGRAIFPVTALAALSTGQFLLEETITDESPFDLYEATNPPGCWIAPEQQWRHQQQSLSAAFANACDYCFYVLASRISAEDWVKTGSALGLDSLSGLGLSIEQTGVLPCQATVYHPERSPKEQDLPIGEVVYAALIAHLRQQAEANGVTASDDAFAPCAEALLKMAVEKNQPEWIPAIREIVGEQLAFPESALMSRDLIELTYNYLCQIKWTGDKMTRAAVGGSVTQITPIAMARYWTTLGNGGRLYKASLLKKDAPELIADYSGEIGDYLPVIREGLSGLVDATGTSHRAYRDWDQRYNISVVASSLAVEQSAADATGTWLTALFPQEQPEITVVVFLEQGGQTNAAGEIFIRTVDQYLAGQAR